MDRPPPTTAARLSALAAALLAITFNFLQPLVHAAAMRDGAPQALWGVFCNAAVADSDSGPQSDGAPAPAHDCCLGLAHAVPVVSPTADFAVLAPLGATLASSLPAMRAPAVAIRDGPQRPRGPPFVV